MPGPWLVYVIALSAIALPALVMVCVRSIPADRFEFADLRGTASRGEFLIPVMILCAEAVRCWVVEVRPPSRRGRYIRNVACVFCVITGIVSFAATIIAASIPASTATGRSLVAITSYAVAVAALCGLLAVIGASASRGSR